MAALDTSAAVGVIGAGTMGGGIAQVAAAAGHQVLLYDAVAGAAREAMATIAASLDKRVSRGRLEPAAKDAVMASLTPATQLAQLRDCALVVEAIAESLDSKQELFRHLEEICHPDTILASNTSSLSITAIAAGLREPGRLVGMHFFNPATVMRLVEVVSGAETDEATAKTVYATAAAWGKKPVHARSSPGFIANRVARPFYGESLRALEEGVADAATIDALLRESGGFPMGPFQLMDLIGNDINFAVSRSVYQGFHQDPRFKPSRIQQELVAAGHFGRKSGRGFYRYGEGLAPPEPSTAAAAPRPAAVTVHGDLGPAEQLVELISATGIHVQRQAGSRAMIDCGPVRIALADGQYAGVRSAAENITNLVTFDLAADYTSAGRIALAAADQADRQSLKAAVGLFQAIGKEVSIIDDYPGLLVMRTVCMLANEAADTVNQRIGDPVGVDDAMLHGFNYPRGPLRWAGEIGLDRVLQVLGNLLSTYGEERYRSSPLLQRMQASGRNFLE